MNQASSTTTLISRYWKWYSDLIDSNVDLHLSENIGGLTYWRTRLFSNTLKFLFPISVIPLTFGVIMSILGDIPVLAIVDLGLFFVLGAVVLKPGLRLSFRKLTFVALLYITAIALLLFLGSFGPGLIYLLGVTVFVAMIFDSKLAYRAVIVNGVICTAFGFLIHFKWFTTKLTEVYDLGSWIAVSSNLMLISAVMVPAMNVLFKGLERTILRKEALEVQLRRESEALGKMLETLKIKNQELEQFAYIASHDLQEPLRTITGYTELLKSTPGNHSDSEIFLENIFQSAGRMQALIKDLLEYSRIGHNKLAQQINCNLVVEQIISDLELMICENNAKIHVHQLPSIEGYKTELTLLFQNLLSNAIKFHREGIPPEITIDATEQPSYWQFSVKDNGIGLDSRFREKVFVIFQRLHPKGKYEGTGIGLAHCKKIVELHGGKIWVETNQEGGCTFFFTIPKELDYA